MISTAFQNIVTQMADVFPKKFGIVDSHGLVLANNGGEPTGDIIENLVYAATNNDKLLFKDGYTVRSMSNKPYAEYVVYVEGTDEVSKYCCNSIVVAANNVRHYYDEKYDRSNFIKNVILDNILPGDIYLKARELRFNTDVSRVCMLIKITNKSDVSAYDVIQNLFPDKTKDFIININETDIALVKEIRSDIEMKDLDKLASSIVDTLSSEYYIHCMIGIGTIVVGIKDLARSFKEAQVAMEVGKVFDTEKTIVSYDNLGIARLIYQLPTTLCDMFLKEVFKRGSIESLDHETLFTIQRFFENNLNVSETSRKLFVHRNTLVYRLEKIKKITGLDLREFEDAIVFKVALMVKKYLSSSPVKF